MQHMTDTISTDQDIERQEKTRPTKTVSKKSTLVRLLSNPKGARVLSLCKALGWQKHTVRAAVSGLRADGYVVETHPSSKDGITVYRITGRPGAVAST